MAYFKIITACLLFGSVGLFIKQIPLSSEEIVLFRTLLGGIFLTIIALVRKEKFDREIIKKNFPKLLLAGVLLGSNWTLLYESYKYAPVGIATLLHYLAPVFVMIFSPIILKEKLTKPKVIGIIATVIGMFLVSGQLSPDANLKMVLFTGVGSAVLYGLLIVVNKTIEGVSGLIMTIFQLYVATIIMFIYVMATKTGPFVMPRGIGLVSLLILAFIHTGIGEYFYISSMKDLSAQSVALLSYIDPVSALFFSSIFLGEDLSPKKLLGAALILGGAAYGELRGTRNKKSKKEKLEGSKA